MTTDPNPLTPEDLKQIAELPTHPAQEGALVVIHNEPFVALKPSSRDALIAEARKVEGLEAKLTSAMDSQAMQYGMLLAARARAESAEQKLRANHVIIEGGSAAIKALRAERNAALAKLEQADRVACSAMDRADAAETKLRADQLIIDSRGADIEALRAENAKLREQVRTQNLYTAERNRLQTERDAALATVPDVEALVQDLAYQSQCGTLDTGETIAVIRRHFSTLPVPTGATTKGPVIEPCIANMEPTSQTVTSAADCSTQAIAGNTRADVPTGSAGQPGEAKCPRCEGTGRYQPFAEDEKPCSLCAGTGLMSDAVHPATPPPASESPRPMTSDERTALDEFTWKELQAGDDATPETDARVLMENPIGKWGNTAMVSTSFARGLECERDAWKQRAERMKLGNGILERERDEARRALAEREAELSELRRQIAGLSDPVAVQTNILRGNIALPMEYAERGQVILDLQEQLTREREAREKADEKAAHLGSQLKYAEENLSVLARTLGLEGGTWNWLVTEVIRCAWRYREAPKQPTREPTPMVSGNAAMDARIARAFDAIAELFRERKFSVMSLSDCFNNVAAKLRQAAPALSIPQWLIYVDDPESGVLPLYIDPEEDNARTTAHHNNATNTGLPWKVRKCLIVLDPENAN